MRTPDQRRRDIQIGVMGFIWAIVGALNHWIWAVIVGFVVIWFALIPWPEEKT